MDEELIEIDDNELFLGDQHLKIDSSNLTKKEEEDVPTVDEAEEENVDDEDLLEVDLQTSTSNEESSEEDNEPVVKDEDEDSEEEDAEGEQEEETNSFAAFGSLLKEKAFFPNVSDEDISNIKDEDDLADLLATQLNTTFKEQMDRYKQNLVQNLVKEGYVNKEDVSDKLPQTYTEEDIKGDIKVAKAVIEKYYRRIGTPAKEIQRIIDTREDLEESALELNALNADMDAKADKALADKLKAQEEQALVQRQQFEETLRNNTFAYSEFIPGRKLRPKDKEKVFTNIEPTLNKINSDLGKYGPLLSYLNEFGILDGNFDKLIKEGASKQVSKFSKILAEKPKKKGGSSHRKRAEGIVNIDDSDVPLMYK
jgi:hypothetical protein